MGYDALLAATGQRALEILRGDGEQRDRIRAILLDLSMPDLPGSELLPMLRLAAPDVPVIVLSGHVPDASSLGSASAIVQKPVGQAELAAALRSTISPS